MPERSIVLLDDPESWMEAHPHARVDHPVCASWSCGRRRAVFWFKSEGCQKGLWRSARCRQHAHETAARYGLAIPDAGIHYVTGDATDPQTFEPWIIAHVCNDRGGWGRGFVTAISRRSPRPEAAYRRWKGRALGRTQLVHVDRHKAVANMVAQAGYRSPANPVPLRLDALEVCLTELAPQAIARGATIHMPRIGCGLAGGDWSQVAEVIERTLVAEGLRVTVYDLPRSNPDGQHERRSDP